VFPSPSSWALHPSGTGAFSASRQIHSKFYHQNQLKHGEKYKKVRFALISSAEKRMPRNSILRLSYSVIYHLLLIWIHSEVPSKTMKFLLIDFFTFIHLYSARHHRRMWAGTKFGYRNALFHTIYSDGSSKQITIM
jgi:hypothetical protein